MRKVRDVLRLKHTLGMSLRQISEATGVGKTVVGEYVRRAAVIGITWPVPEEIDDAELERRLFPVAGATAAPRPAIDWRQVHEEMKRRSVTLVLLWQEYRAEQVDGYGYSRFCDLYGELLRDNLDENGASIWMRRGGRGERQLTMAAVLARL
jgi:transposase